MMRFFNTDIRSGKIDISLLILRVGVSLLMLTHGLPKIGRLAQDPVEFIDFLGLGASLSLMLAVFGEVVCSLFVFVGLGTRLAVIPSIITMLVVVFHVHLGDGLAKQELGLHYLIVYLVLLIMGSGRYSLDYLFFSGSRARLQTAISALR